MESICGTSDVCGVLGNSVMQTLDKTAHLRPPALAKEGILVIRLRFSKQPTAEPVTDAVMAAATILTFATEV